MKVATSTCLMLLIHLTRRALSLALDSAGKSIAARMAMMAITTSNSMRVKPLELLAVGRPSPLRASFVLEVCLAVIFVSCSNLDGDEVDASASSLLDSFFCQPAQ